MGVIYEANIDGNTLWCDWLKWNHYPIGTGRAGAITIHDDGSVTLEQGNAGQWQKHGRLDLQWKAPYKAVRGKIPTKVKKAYLKAKEEKEKVEQD